MGDNDDRRLTVHGASRDTNMSVTGKLLRDGRVRETLYREPNGERSTTAVEQTREIKTTSEYMSQCKYKS